MGAVVIERTVTLQHPGFLAGLGFDIFAPVSVLEQEGLGKTVCRNTLSDIFPLPMGCAFIAVSKHS